MELVSAHRAGPSGGLTLPAISHVFTITYVAEILGEQLGERALVDLDRLAAQIFTVLAGQRRNGRPRCERPQCGSNAVATKRAVPIP